MHRERQWQRVFESLYRGMLCAGDLEGWQVQPADEVSARMVGSLGRPIHGSAAVTG